MLRSPRKKKDASQRAGNLIAFALLIMLLFGVLAVYQSSQAYKVASEEARDNARRLTQIMSQQIEMTLLDVDTMLQRAVEQQYYNELFGGNLPDYMLQKMQGWVEGSPRVGALIFVDENGKPQIAAHKKGFAQWLDYKNNQFHDTPLFTQLLKGNDKDCYIGLMAGTGPSATNMMVMARKIIKADGGFGGVYVAALDPTYFIEYFHSVELGNQSYISLQLLDSGLKLTNTATTHEVYGEIDEQVLKHAKFAPQPNQSFVGTLTGEQSIQVYAFELMKSFPVITTVVLDQEDFLRSWKQTRIKDIGFLAIFIIFGSVLSFFSLAMARQIEKVEESEAAAVLASQAKSEFLANMSHELRTPLNAIIGFSEMMNSGYFGPLNAKQKERVHDINLCGTHLLQLITDILEFSKGDAGKLELVEEKVIMQDLVNEALRMVQDKVKNKQMNVIVDVETSLPAMLGDKRKIRQILLNLLSNSLKFTPEQGTIKVAAKVDESSNMTLTVSDTGMGMAEEDIPVALSVFGQVHRNQSHEGTGLGLPLCKMFAELHGGKLAMGSALGEGTTVRIIFPASRNLPNSQTSNAPAASHG